MNEKTNNYDRKIISVSFRNTSDDIKMYKIISKHYSQSGFIKDILKEVLLKENKG